MLYKKLKQDMRQDAVSASPFVYKGAYLADTTYKKGDIVTYNNKHYVYIEDTPTENIVPTNTTHWEEFSLFFNNQPGGSDLSQYYTKTETDNKFANKTSTNVFTQTNQFKTVNVGGNSNQNRVFVDNFDYSNKNISAVKFVKGSSTNLLQIQANNTDNSVQISAPGASSFKIAHLSAPTDNNDAATKKYVDDAVANAASASVDLSNYYTKTETNNRFPSYTYLNNNHYTKTESDNKYGLKTDVSDLQSEINNKANSADLNNYALKPTTVIAIKDRHFDTRSYQTPTNLWVYYGRFTRSAFPEDFSPNNIIRMHPSFSPLTSFCAISPISGWDYCITDFKNTTEQNTNGLRIDVTYIPVSPEQAAREWEVIEQRRRERDIQGDNQ